MKTFKQHLNEKVPKDDLNWITTGGSFGKKRRFPTFIVKKEGNKYKAYDEQIKMDFKVGSNSLEGLAKMLKPYIKKRTGSWKFEEVELDEKTEYYLDTSQDNTDKYVAKDDGGFWYTGRVGIKAGSSFLKFVATHGKNSYFERAKLKKVTPEKLEKDVGMTVDFKKLYKR